MTTTPQATYACQTNYRLLTEKQFISDVKGQVQCRKRWRDTWLLVPVALWWQWLRLKVPMFFFSCYNNGTGYTNGIGFRKEIESILFCNMDSISFSEFFFSILEIIFFNLKKKRHAKKITILKFPLNTLKPNNVNYITSPFWKFTVFFLPTKSWD